MTKLDIERMQSHLDEGGRLTHENGAELFEALKETLTLVETMRADFADLWKEVGELMKRLGVR